jgi:iron(III) transport system permease protein
MIEPAGTRPAFPVSASKHRAPVPIVVLGVGTAAIVNLPLLHLLGRSAEGGAANYVSTVFSAATGELLVHTLVLVFGVAGLALAIAVPMAWLVVRTDLRAHRFWAVVGALPLVYPSFVSAFALVAVLGPRGYVQSWLGVERLPGWIYGYPGALLSLALFTYPYIYLLLVAALRVADPAQEESSRSLGAGRWRTFFRVVLPQLRGPALAGTLLVVLYALSDFGAVSIMRYNTLTLAIYNAYRSLFDRSVAASVSTVLVVLAIAAIGLQAMLQRRTRPVRAGVGGTHRRVPLGRWQWPCQFVLAAVALLSLGATTGVLLHWGIRALREGNALGPVWDATLNSVGVSVIAAIAALLLSIPVSVWSVRYRSLPARAAERLSYAGFALPGLIIALSLVFLTARHAGFLYQTLALLVIAYVIRFLPESLSATRSALADVSPAFEEAGRSLGRGPLGVLRQITLPLIRPGLLAGGGLVFLTAMKELPATLILRPAGFETLATRVWSAAADGVFSEAALPALLLLLASAAPVYLLAIRPALAGRS